MKIICTQENLKFALAKVTRIITSSNTLPVLNNLLLKTENGLLRISSTNLEISIDTMVRCKVEESGEVCLPAKIFYDLVSSLPNTNITITKDSNNVSVNADGYSSKIKYLSTDEFPVIPTLENIKGLKIPSQDLYKALSLVIFSASTNETQPEISGVFIASKNGTCLVVATDRYRLAEYKINISDNIEFSAIIPYKSSQELLKSLSGADRDAVVEIAVAENQILFTIEDTNIISRLVEGEYPEYGNIIPHEFLTTITCDRQELLYALKASGVFSQSANSVQIVYEEGSEKLVISSGSQDMGESTVLVNAVVSGPGGSILFNYRYIQDSLAVITAGGVVLQITNDTAPVVIREVGNDQYMYLVMPIKN